MKTGLYIQEPDLRLRLDADTLRVQYPDGHSDALPMENLELLVLEERTTLTAPLLGMLRERAIAVSWVDWRGRLLARMEPHPSKNALMRRAQIEAANDPARSMEIARRMVRAKIHNQRVFLMRHRRRGVEIPEALLMTLKDMAQQTAHAPDRDHLMGVEGMAARTYFEAFPILLENTGFSWDGRNRRPPKDPVNALLSYGYALLAGDCSDAAANAGLDPYVGFLHAEKVGRPELALDLMEELRCPLVDALVLGLIRRRVLHPDGFAPGEDGGLRMSDETRKAFLVAWSEQRQSDVQHPLLGTTHRTGHMALIQARLLGKHCMGLLPEYTPYIWR